MKGAFAFVLLACAALAYALFYNEGLHVVVENLSDRPLCNLRVETSGGTQARQVLQPGDRMTFSVRPKGESGLSLTYVSGGEQHAYAAPVYLERDYAGTIDIAVRNNGEIRTDADVSLY